MCVSAVSYVLEQVFLLSYDNSVSWKPVNKTVYIVLELFW